MKQNRIRSAAAGMLLLAVLNGGCAAGTAEEALLPFVYTGSQSYEYYDVGNDRNANFLTGRASEVCIPSQDTNSDETSEYVYGLYRITDHEVLEQYHITEQIYPASTTKLLTTMVALKYCDLSESVVFSHHASHIGVYGAVLCGFEEGDTVLLGDLISAFLVCSGNDAGIAIAEHVSGSVENFAELMNAEAKKLGAVDSHFTNPHGLHDANHYTTAYDMYLILDELVHYNKFISTISQHSCTIEYQDANGNVKSKTFESTNLFFNGTFKAPEGITIIGGKTGTTNAAGCCLMLYFKDETGYYYIAEVFHAPSYEILYGTMIKLMQSVSAAER